MNINDIKRHTQSTCTVCATTTEAAIDLPAYPITELYEETEFAFEGSGFFDQQLAYCPECDHAHLRSILDVNFIYENYLTHSSGSWGAEKCLISFLKFIKKNTDITNYQSIIDIGGNDSYFLNMIEDDLIKKINIDPNATGDAPVIVEKCGIENLDLSQYSDDRKIIVSSHTIEHLEDPKKMVSAIAAAMGSDDQCFLQFPSLEMMVKEFRFDQICHQHLNLFSISSINKLLNSFGLYVETYEYDVDHFGTLRVQAKKGKNTNTNRFPRVSQNEITQNYQTYRDYFAALNASIEARKGNVSGFGAGLMVPTLSYSLPAISTLNYLYDDDPNKIGKRFINIDVEIRPTSEMDPEETILLASISTKMTLRRILVKLIEKDLKNLIIPNLTF